MRMAFVQRVVLGGCLALSPVVAVAGERKVSDLRFEDLRIRSNGTDMSLVIAEPRVARCLSPGSERDPYRGKARFSTTDWEKRAGHWCRLLTHWTWNGHEGREVEFAAETDCPQASLLLNGKPFGEVLTAAHPGAANRFAWKVPYAPGLVQVLGIKDGAPCIDRGVRTSGAPVRVRLFPENKTGSDYAVKVFAEDKDGVRNPLAAHAVRLSVEGPATVEPAAVALKDGCASVRVRRTGAGEIRLTGRADGLEPMVVTYGKVVPERTEQSFTLASVNFRAAMGCDPPPHFWLERAPRLVEVIESRGYDVIGMQEPERVWCERVVELLPGWKCLYRGREADGEGESASLLWNDARFQLVKDGSFWLSETPDVPGSKSWRTACPRTCTWGRFRDRKTGKEFLLFNTHLDCSSFLARSKGMRVLLDRLLEIRAAEGVPAVLMGDLNISMWPGYMPIDENHPLVMAHKMFKESWDVSETPHSGPVESYTGFGPIDRAYESANRAKPPAERSIRGQIDHLLVTDGFRVLTSGTADDCPQGLRVSDHYSIFSDVEIR